MAEERMRGDAPAQDGAGRRDARQTRCNTTDDAKLEAAVERLVNAWGAAMLRVHASSRAVAEEVVQESWMVMLRELDRYEGRSSLQTWVLGIVNMARPRGKRAVCSRSATQACYCIGPDRAYNAIEDYFRATEPT